MIRGMKYKFQKLFLIILLGSILLSSIYLSFHYLENRKAKYVVLITVDALRPDHLGCYGYERDTSPNIDNLARQGVKFINVMLLLPVGLPSFLFLLFLLVVTHLLMGS